MQQASFELHIKKNFYFFYSWSQWTDFFFVSSFFSRQFILPKLLWLVFFSVNVPFFPFASVPSKSKENKLCSFSALRVFSFVSMLLLKSCLLLVDTLVASRFHYRQTFANCTITSIFLFVINECKIGYICIFCVAFAWARCYSSWCCATEYRVPNICTQYFALNEWKGCKRNCF